jgi:hypothetical protein
MRANMTTPPPPPNTEKPEGSWVFMGLFLSPFISTAIFILLKLVGAISWSWLAVFSPIIVVVGLIAFAAARYQEEVKPDLTGLSPEEARDKEMQALFENDRRKYISWSVVAWIWGGLWHWVFGESEGDSSPLWWQVL